TDQGLVADELKRTADQDRREGREPRPLCRLPNGRGRHASATVPGNSAAHRGTAATAATRRSGVHAFKCNRRDEHVRKPGEMARSASSTAVPTCRCDGIRPHSAFDLQQAAKARIFTAIGYSSGESQLKR